MPFNEEMLSFMHIFYVSLKMIYMGQMQQQLVGCSEIVKTKIDIMVHIRDTEGFL